MLSFLPIWELFGSRKVLPIPRSLAATSKEHLVLVLFFSKIRAIFFPLRTSTGSPFFFFSFSFADRSIKYSISSFVKSFSVRKFRPFKFILLFLLFLFLYI